MRFNINLASQPYEDAGRFYLTWVPLTLGLAVLAVFMSALAWQHHNDSRSVQTQLAEKQKRMDELDKELADARTTLNLPQNSGTRDQSQFLNELFARKSFSWTKVLSDLETVMPQGVQVLSIKPEVNQQNGQLQFNLVVAADRREDAIELARRMEKSPRFFQPAIRNERTKHGDKDNRINVEIVSQYVPMLKKGNLLMADLRQQRKQFAAAAIAFAAVAALAALYLVVPLGASNAELNSDLKQITKELDIKEKQAAPLRGLPEKLVATSQDITKFYRDRLPDRQSDISEELGRLASAQGIQLSDVKYENFDTDIPAIRAVVVEAQLAGEYSKIAKFINAVERDNMFLIVDGLTLDDQKAGAVRLQLRFGTCLRPSGIASAPADKSAEDKSADKENAPAEKKVTPAIKSPNPPITKPANQGVKH